MKVAHTQKIRLSENDELVNLVKRYELMRNELLIWIYLTNDLKRKN